MHEEIAKKIFDLIAQEMSRLSFGERYDNVSLEIVGVIKKSWNPFRRVLGGHGISVVVIVPALVTNRERLKTFFESVRKEINSRFVGFAAYKSSYSFIILICAHDLFTECSGMASRLKDKTGLHKNIVQGVILVDAETREVRGDYTRPSQHKREYDTVLSSTTRAVK